MNTPNYWVVARTPEGEVEGIFRNMTEGLAAIEALRASGRKVTDWYGNVTTQPRTDRLDETGDPDVFLTMDETEVLGLDGTGRDGDPRFPFRRATLTAAEMEALVAWHRVLAVDSTTDFAARNGLMGSISITCPCGFTSFALFSDSARRVADEHLARVRGEAR